MLCIKFEDCLHQHKGDLLLIVAVGQRSRFIGIGQKAALCHHRWALPFIEQKEVVPRLLDLPLIVRL